VNIASSSAPTSTSSQPVDRGVYITVHGHFYQPPRENPYLNAIERQDSAAPFHNWNQRIHHECYRPNAFARVMTGDGKLLKIVNNFEYFSFNIGATLLSWMEQHDPVVYQRILDGDKRSAERLNGHGNAIAQVYNHIILPLANWRDKLTQIRWGKADFRSRFGREPEGMWLAETAVDRETLEALIQEDIKFIVLAPSQAQRCRPIPNSTEHQSDWTEVSGAQIDPNRPYRCYLENSSGDSVADASSRTDSDARNYIDIFFYDGPISRDMGFGDLLNSSYNFAARLGQAVRGDRRTSQLISVATDGETFGHHKHFTEMSLAFAFEAEFPNRGWVVTNYAHYLSLYPPTWEVAIKPVTAWSCAHGVDRWQEDCGCGTAVGHGTWRKPLRQSLNWLRDRLGDIFADTGSKYFIDPWAARDAYIDLLRDSLRHGIINNDEKLKNFFHNFGRLVDKSQADRVDALRLLEMQRHALLMFTSCGWFFEELSRPEGVQILRYAARAIELAADVTGILLEPEFMQRLEKCPSNLELFGNGAEVYRQHVLTSKISLQQVAAHYAISSLFTNYLRSQQLYCYTIEQHDYQLQRMGSMTLAIGQIQLTSGITQESVDYEFAVLHLGGDDFHCCISPFTGRREYEQIKLKLFKALQEASAATLILAMADVFGGAYFNLHHLFAEERHRILHLLAGETLMRLDQLYAQVYRDNYGILASFRRDGVSVPPELQVAADITLNNRLMQELKRLESGESLPITELDVVAIEADSLGCNLNRAEAAKILQRAIVQQIWQLTHQDETSLQDKASRLDATTDRDESEEMPIFHRLNQIELALDLAFRLHVSLDLNQAQELLLDYLRQAIAPSCRRALSIMSEQKTGNQPNTMAIALCETISNQELHQLMHISEKMAIAISAWLLPHH
jgi:alpha-amylase/alpha-mannosidase (GH57 family)